MELPFLHIAIPLMNESENLSMLLSDLQVQSYPHYRIVFCVNQPDQWWTDPDKRAICEDNQKTLSILSGMHPFSTVVIDKTSPGNGWQGKQYGVGWARKLCMDACIRDANPSDVIISLDADTRFGQEYFLSVAENLASHPSVNALSVPYYHPLTMDDNANRSILHYEIYMRSFAVNLWRIRSPYSFTALGSAMAVTVKAYRAIRGITPNKSGEDFYFLQKIRKYGEVLFWNPEKVLPAARFSDRVFFGTGPAMIKGSNGDWSSYPIYCPTDFDRVAVTTKSFPSLYYQTVETPMDAFLGRIFQEDDPWKPLRQNHKDTDRFVRACHEKVDGLRILQFLKESNDAGNNNDIQNLTALFQYVNDMYEKDYVLPASFDFNTSSIEDIELVRNSLAGIEEQFQYQHYLSMPKAREL